MLKILDWIDINKLNWDYLSKNSNAIKLLKENKNKINWNYLSSNPNATELLQSSHNTIDWNGYTTILKKNKN